MLIKEIGWVSLSDRRKIQKLISVYKTENDLLPHYLETIFPRIVSETTEYQLRNNNNYTTIARRTQIYSNSFIPSSTELWNELNTDVRNSATLNIFKSKLKEFFKAPAIPKHFLCGDRLFAILHARLRNRCSNLNNDLFRNHISEYPYCDCGYPVENAEHFFFQCFKFNDERIILFHETRSYHPLNVELLLSGSDTLNVDDNKLITTAVQKFIKHSRRFN